ncbi:MAG: CRISPR-associated endonuclease Cas2 [Chloroflexota bacterium]|nr:MAG: CRISPR-associated endonuclease Cas2 [Chloroflexota bacterium]
MEILVTYDVATDSAAGRRRLRRVAKACEAFGQRVQKSVFECTLGEADLEKLKHRLEREMNPKEDSLRFYRLLEPRERYLQTMGVQPVFDMHDPLVV